MGVKELVANFGAYAALKEAWRASFPSEGPWNCVIVSQNQAWSLRIGTEGVEIGVYSLVGVEFRVRGSWVYVGRGWRVVPLTTPISHAFRFLLNYKSG